jgi:dihydroorotate dehydrogenase (NAD+) catalytic subunit
VQLGTQNFVDPDASGRIVRDLDRRLREDGISDVRELIGALRIA